MAVENPTYAELVSMMSQGVVEPTCAGELVIYTGWAIDPQDPTGRLIQWCECCESGADVPEDGCGDCGREPTIEDVPETDLFGRTGPLPKENLMDLDQLLANARGIGTFVGCIAIEAASLLKAVTDATAALEAGDVDKAKLVLGNVLAPGTTFHIETLDLTAAQPASGTSGY